MKTGIVLSGGGTRGAYQLGAWKALKESNINYHIITGTSIGAINGILMIRNAYDEAYKLWTKLKIEDIMLEGISLDISLETIYSEKENLLSFLKYYIKNKGANISPLKNQLKKITVESEIYKSKIDFGFITVQFPSLIPFEIKKNTINPKYLSDYLLASSSCFPAFPMCKIKNQTFIDGGYYDNLPIDLAIKMGASQIIAIDLFQNSIHPYYKNKSFITYVHPKQSLGGILNFNSNIIENNISYGYQDTLKALKKLYGFQFSFYKTNKNKYINMANNFLDILIKTQAFSSQSKIIINFKHQNPLFDLLETYADNKTMSKFDYFIRALEIICENLNLSPIGIYSIDEVINNLTEKINNNDIQKNEYRYYIKRIISKKNNLKTSNNTQQEMMYSIKCIYNYINDFPTHFFTLNKLSTILPKELIASIFFYSLKNMKS